MNKALKAINILYLLLFSLCANGYLIFRSHVACIYIATVFMIYLCAISGILPLLKYSLRWRICHHGESLLRVFSGSLVIAVLYHIVLAIYWIPKDYKVFLNSAILCIITEAILFWTGIICVYCASYQLGIKLRAIGLICGMIPIANLIMLHRIIKTVRKEVAFETQKEDLNRKRSDRKICQTKYPILFVHGVFFRDSRKFNYWGRIPKELTQNGATVYYGEHQSALSVADSAAELSERIKKIVAETGCEKVNIIAHSKGGLDCRYAISKLGIAKNVASLTTINTPHRGCIFADKLLNYAGDGVKQKVAGLYNTALKKLGDENPDFLTAIYDLTAPVCEAYDKELTVPDYVYCQSFGSKLNKATSGQFPLNFSYHIVKFFDGPNDGLVGESSFAWGETYQFMTTEGKRGISHGDMIDLNRENIDGFDVREFYVNLVENLKKRGL